MVAHRTITLAQEGAAIVVRARATTPTPLTGSTAWSTAARAGYTGRSGTGSGPARGRFSPAGERDLTRIAGCASTGALLHPGGDRWGPIFPRCRRTRISRRGRSCEDGTFGGEPHVRPGGSRSSKRETRELCNTLDLHLQPGCERLRRARVFEPGQDHFPGEKTRAVPASPR